MKPTYKKTMMFMIVLLALMLSAVGVTPALAEDGVTPPVDAPVVEEPVVDVPVVEEPVVVSEILDAAPEGTEVVVLDENGEALPLASDEAAVVLAAPDPYFTVAGITYRFFDSAGDCSAYTLNTDCFISAGDTPIQDAIDFLAALDATPDDGYIFVEGGTYNENVTIDGSRWSGLGDFGLIGAGSDVTTINGYLDVFNLSNAFDLAYFTFTDQVYVVTDGDVYMYDVVVDGTTSTGGLNILSGGMVELDSVTSFQSSYDGLYVNAAGDINIWDSAFYENTEDGAYLYSDSGSIYIENSDFFNNNNSGVVADAYGDITLNSVLSAESILYGADLYSYDGGIFVNDSELFRNGDWDLVLDSYYAQICDTTFTDEEIVGCVFYEYEDEEDAKTVAPVFETAPVEEVFSAATLPEITLENLPAPLPETLADGSTFEFAGGFSAANIEIPEGGSVKISFSLPDDLDPENLVILMWNGTEWLELTDFIILPDGTIELTIEFAGDIVFGQ